MTMRICHNCNQLTDQDICKVCDNDVSRQPPTLDEIRSAVSDELLRCLHIYHEEAAKHAAFSPAAPQVAGDVPEQMWRTVDAYNAVAAERDAALEECARWKREVHIAISDRDSAREAERGAKTQLGLAQEKLARISTLAGSSTPAAQAWREIREVLAGALIKAPTPAAPCPHLHMDGAPAWKCKECGTLMPMETEPSPALARALAETKAVES